MKRDYKLPHRRRRNKKTDYKLRLALLKKGKNRLAIRKSNNYVTGQIIKYEKDGDKTMVSVSSRALKKMGWKRSCNSIPAAYLTGMLLGRKCEENKIGEATLDLGLQTSTRGNRLYAFLKGALDSGLKVSHSKDILPGEDRLYGKHIDESMTKEFESMKNKIMK
ncbi:MAG: 50S ribosomal protein L18 [archaeon]|nr:MAG: 50S ribosomal protein L18 [archaeon]